MTTLELKGWAAGESSLQAFGAALGRLTARPLFSLTIWHLGVGRSDFAEGRAGWPSLGGEVGPNGQLSWDEIPVADAVRIVRQHDEPGLHAYADFELRAPLDPVGPASLYVYGEEHRRRYPSAPLKIMFDADNAWPPGMTDGELETFVADFLGTGDRDTRARSGILMDEGRDESPFNAYAVMSTTADLIAMDFARGWLCAHTNAPVTLLVLLPREEMRRVVEDATEAPAEGVIANHYDGSLSRADVLRILAAPPGDVLAAVEVACIATAGSRDARSPFAPGGRDVVSSFTPRTRRIAGSGLFLGAGPFQPLWRIYREAASLLLE